MKALFVSGREITYPRNAMMLECLQNLGDVTVVQLPMRRQSILLRSLLGSLKSISLMRRMHYDLVFAGFFGHLLMMPITPFARCPILFDAFISAYDTMIIDRNMANERSVLARAAFLLDQKSCQNADHVLLDTRAQCEYFAKTFNLPVAKLERVLVGCDERIFYPRQVEAHNGIRVLFYGSFLPLHGVSVILKAAALLPGIGFTLIGGGSVLPEMKQFAQHMNLMNVTFKKAVPLAALPDEIAMADICLGGHFGGSSKARRVIAGKTYQCLAMGKATIVSDNPANNELLTPGLDACFCQHDDAESLAGAIQALVDDDNMRVHMGAAALATFRQYASLDVIQRQVASITARMLASGRG